MYLTDLSVPPELPLWRADRNRLTGFGFGKFVVIKRATRVVTSLSRWETPAPTEEDVLNTIELQERHQLSFWDAVIVTRAGKLGCRVLYSEDLSGPQVIAGFQVVNPFLRGNGL